MSAYRKSVLITGCSAGGIGHALAIEYNRYGYRVFATARKLDSMSELAGLGVETSELDVTDSNAIQELRQAISVKTGGKLDILVNNAGQGYDQAISDASVARTREIIEVNLVAPMVMLKEFVHLLIASGDGRVAQIGSITGIMPIPFNAAYSASKAGIHSFSNSARIELAPFNVKVINILTGVIDSKIWREGSLPADSLYKPMEDLYQQHRINIPSQGTTPTEEYARAVVRETTKTTPSPWVWIGKNTMMVWLMDTFLPRTAWDYLLNHAFGINEFVARLAKRKTQTVEVTETVAAQ
ncbi:Short-chain dehydrogenase/reductase family protein [Mycena indigotica]|uniref:Short-chain dehydrogenase/reductase family protein n=1 Tax=Mycena indigotica TaxID=2126181 RepID=A0A8H6W9M9_9AGAR|nr:Short-chain dehydrogenase/reductase family protein [Mycena indigotica]KAF7309857.1 Short-chain dehydrogenase/reductase family protein [Mycena indigotica]